MKTRAKSLKEVAKELNVSLREVNLLRKKLIKKYKAPECMIHGTNGYKWDVDAFRTVL